MIKTQTVRYIEYPATGKTVIERLWEPDRGDSDLDRPEWRVEDETTVTSVPYPAQMPGCEAW